MEEHDFNWVLNILAFNRSNIGVADTYIVNDSRVTHHITFDGYVRKRALVPSIPVTDCLA
jgi:hypothetical protein